MTDFVVVDMTWANLLGVSQVNLFAVDPEVEIDLPRVGGLPDGGSLYQAEFGQLDGIYKAFLNDGSGGYGLGIMYPDTPEERLAVDNVLSDFGGVKLAGGELAQVVDGLGHVMLDSSQFFDVPVSDIASLAGSVVTISNDAPPPQPVVSPIGFDMP